TGAPSPAAGGEDLELRKVAQLLDVVSQVTGVRDPDELVRIIEAALTTPLDAGAMPSAAVGMAKAITASPTLPTTCVRGPGIAELEAREEAQRLEHLAANGVRVHPDKLREAVTTADAIAA